ncbi:MAG TPA: glycosyl hydrolase family 65 protein, partial [Mycobacterium sp.]|nr:glycosyl hydrolase family 65 protein [Mycobacterium sp.]
LADLDWDAYWQRYGDIRRLDRILEAEGDSPNRYKVAKQADVAMLFYLLSAEEVGELLERLGYPHDGELVEQNVTYYKARTSHGSSLSRVVHAWIEARRDPTTSWNLFLDALGVDANDGEDTTAEGIHLGAMAGTIDLLQRCYTGLHVGDGRMRFAPVLPEPLRSLQFDARYSGRLLHCRFTTERTQIQMDPTETVPVHVEIEGRAIRLQPGQTIEVSFSRGRRHGSVPGSEAADRPARPRVRVPGRPR